jgi:hypothetical protein
VWAEDEGMNDPERDHMQLERNGRVILFLKCDSGQFSGCAIVLIVLAGNR